MNEIRFTIPLPPRTKKNSMQILTNPRTKRSFIAPSSAYKAYRAAALMTIPEHVRLGIDYPVNIRAIYFMETRRKVDRPNLEEALLDILVDAGVLADDNAKIAAMSDGSKVMYDKDHPRTEITITRL